GLRHCRRTSDASGKVRRTLRGGTGGEAGLVLSAALLARAEPRRTRVERSEVPRHRSQADHLTDAAAADGRLPYAAIAKAADSGALLLPRSHNPLRARLMATIMGRLIRSDSELWRHDSSS